MDRIVQERLQLVRHMYPPELADIIQLMLNYNYLERMGPRDLALLLNSHLSKGVSAVQVAKKQSYTTTHPKIISQQTSQVSNQCIGNASTVIPTATPYLEKSVLNETQQPRPRTVYRQLTPTKS